MEFPQTFNLSAGATRTTVVVGCGILDRLGELLLEISGPDPSGPIALVTDENVAPHHLGRVTEALAASRLESLAIVVPPGEEHKDLRTLDHVLGRLIEGGVGREGWIVALGGGVIGDLAGFAAAIHLRGIAHALVPTTVAAQVDASIGGKTAINHRLGKNLVGAFHQPRLVLSDAETLGTAPLRDHVAGLAEVVKTAAVADEALFAVIEDGPRALLDRDARALAGVVARCVQIKGRIVAADEKDAGPRLVLNFGHTLGHALETLGGYRTWRHGEAVAIGMAVAARLSARLAGCPASDVLRLEAVLAKLGLPTEVPRTIGAEELLELTGRDKKVRARAVRWVLLERLGQPRIVPLRAGELRSCLPETLRRS